MAVLGVAFPLLAVHIPGIPLVAEVTWFVVGGCSIVLMICLGHM